MTDKMLLFCEKYLISFNGAEAVRQSYNKTGDTAKRYAERLLKNQEVIDYIDKRKKELIKNINITQEEVISYLASIIKGEESEKTYFVLREGEKGSYSDSLTSVDIPLKARDRIKACEVINKYFTENKDANNKKPIINIVNNIPRPKEDKDHEE